MVAPAAPTPAATRAADEAALWAAYRATGSVDARNRLLLRYQPLVRRLANRFAYHLPSNVDPDDLVSDGQIGLMRAAASFDPARGYRFATFASHYVRGAMIDAIRAADPVPRNARIAWKHVEALTRDGRPPAPEALAERLGVETGTAARVLLRGEPQPEAYSLDRPIRTTHRGHATPAESLPDPAVPDPSDGIMLRSTFAAARLGMTRAERMVIACYYLEGMTMAETAEAIGMSESRVSQIHKQLLRRMRANRRLRELCDA